MALGDKYWLIAFSSLPVWTELVVIRECGNEHKQKCSICKDFSAIICKKERGGESVHGKPVTFLIITHIYKDAMKQY